MPFVASCKGVVLAIVEIRMFCQREHLVLCRDLLALADSISVMKDAASAALSNVDTIRSDFEQIKTAPFRLEAKQVRVLYSL